MRANVPVDSATFGVEHLSWAPLDPERFELRTQVAGAADDGRFSVPMVDAVVRFRLDDRVPPHPSNGSRR